MSGDGNFKSKDFALRAQKKLLSQFSNRKAVKMFINEGLSTLLDLLYQLIKSHVCILNSYKSYMYLCLTRFCLLY